MSTSGRIIAGIVLVPIVVLVLGIGGCEARKAYYDWQVRKMCEKDGGIRIQEQIQITARQATSMRRVGGHLAIAEEKLAQQEDLAVLRSSTTELRHGSPTLQRLEQSIVRKSDAKVIARVISYSRVGGDFPFTASHPSNFSCPDWPRYYQEIAKVFVIREEAK